MKTTTNIFFWVTLEKVGTLCVQFIANIVLARLLTPDEFGQIGLLAIFLALSNIIVDSGLGGALIRERIVEQKDYSTLFVFNAITSIILYTILFFAAPLIAVFYNNDQLRILIRVLSLCIILNAFAIVQYVKLVRALRMKEMCITALLAAFVSSIIGILMGLHEYGVWSLIFLQLTNAAILSLGYFVLIRETPKLSFSWNSLIKQFSFGGNLLCANVVSVINANISSAVIGKMYSFSSLGFFTQNNKIYSVILNIISSVIDKALFASLTQERKNDVSVYIRTKRISSVIYLILFPIIGTLLVLSTQTITLLFGKQWKESAWILSILLLGGFPVIIKATIRILFKTIGSTDKILKNELLNFMITTVAIIIAIPVSFKMLVVNLSIAQYISAGIFMHMVKERFNESLTKQMNEMMPFLMATLFSGITVYIMRRLMESITRSNILIIALGISVALIIHVLFYSLTKNLLFFLILKSIRQRLGRFF